MAEISDLVCRSPSQISFSEPDSCSVLSQLASALSHCHRLKICDFGSAEWFLGSGGERIPLSGIVGTPYCVAPEILSGRDYNEKVDVWSAGVVLYIMLASVPPFYGDTVEETFQASSDFAPKAIDIAVKELIAVATPGEVNQIELERAKAATKSAILMNLESRIVISEDIGRQLLTYSERKPVEHFLKAIEDITAKDIASLAAKLISSPLTMATYGDGLHLVDSVLDSVPPCLRRHRLRCRCHSAIGGSLFGYDVGISAFIDALTSQSRLEDETGIENLMLVLLLYIDAHENPL